MDEAQLIRAYSHHRGAYPIVAYEPREHPTGRDACIRCGVEIPEWLALCRSCENRARAAGSLEALRGEV